ncbi:MAG: histidine kinase [Sulfobacillus benefaciens]|uniref:histidine kinase n=1 Tax=Sulfobacillus benefaciens TaxID=453960 RepID=A0A2T2XFP4_9FIRM|nr:MAG: histidine kinase [Sulfobacillus benefaciens]
MARQMAATVLAMIGVSLVILVDRLLLVPRLPVGSNTFWLWAILVTFTGLFSFVVFGILRQQHRDLTRVNETLAKQRDRLNALRDATLAITSNFDWEDVLQQVVEVARQLLGARYAALSVLTDDTPQKVSRFITSGLTDPERHLIGEYPQGHGVLGHVLASKKPLRVANLQDHPLAVGVPPHHPVMTTFLGLPLLYHSQVVGHLYLTEKTGGFTDEDQEIGELFARQAAAVIANARLSEDRARLATLSERERIGRDLHDGVLQTLYAATLALDNLSDSPDANPAVVKELTQVSDTLGLLMTDVRFFIQTLENTPVDFRIALNDVVRRLSLTAEVDIVLDDASYLEMPPELIHDLILCIQEALSNASRHGQATKITIHWEKSNDAYHVKISDNGVGFLVKTIDSPAHHGLRNMQRRISDWHGSLKVDSEPGRGTTVSLMVDRDTALNRKHHRTPLSTRKEP